MHTLCTRVRVGVEAARRKARRLGIVCAYSADSVTARAPGSYSYTMLHTPSGWRGRIRYTRLPRRGVALFSRFTICKCIKSISFVRSGAARPHHTPVQSAVRCDLHACAAAPGRRSPWAWPLCLSLSSLVSAFVQHLDILAGCTLLALLKQTLQNFITTHHHPKVDMLTSD
jgi:hypothetical protein